MLSSRGRSLVVWVIVMTTLVTMTMMLRFCAIRVQKRRLRVDDYLVVIAYLSLLALVGAGSWGIANRAGEHLETLSSANMVVLVKVILSRGVTWTLSTTFCKLAILWFYRIIFTGANQELAIDILLSMTAAYGVIFIPVMLTQCSPMSAAWSLDLELIERVCRPLLHQEYASVSINIFLDIAVVLLPLPSVWRLQMPTRKKVGVTLMFGLGVIIVVVLILRLYKTIVASTNPDWPYTMYDTGLLSLLEVQIGIMAANLPNIAPLIPHLGVPRLKSLSQINFRRRRPVSEKDSGGCETLRVDGDGGRGTSNQSLIRTC